MLGDPPPDPQPLPEAAVVPFRARHRQTAQPRCANCGAALKHFHRLCSSCRWYKALKAVLGLRPPA